MKTVLTNEHEIKVLEVEEGFDEKKNQSFQRVKWVESGTVKMGTEEIKTVVPATAKVLSFKVKVGDVFPSGSIEVNEYPMDNGKTYFRLERKIQKQK
jgi:hypothetical protein